MIVKKMPILQGFPDIRSFLSLSIHIDKFSDNNVFFYDIETTGLSKKNNYIYLIGSVKYELSSWYLYQWFAESPEEEPLLLENFASFIKDYSFSTQYNGDRFDQPFLEERFKKYNMESPFKEIISIDLLKHLKKCQSLLKLTSMKQPELEHFLEIDNRLYCDGGECIRLYKKYINTKESCLLDTVLGHNQEDLLGLGKIVTMLSYLGLYDGTYTVINANIIDFKKLLIKLQLPLPIPAAVSNGNEHFYLQMEGTQVQLLISIKNNRLQQFYDDYKNYVYLPSEDSCIPKSLASFMDRSLYQPAAKDTCYTWFSCNEEFLQDQKKIMHYLKHALPHFLKSLK